MATSLLRRSKFVSFIRAIKKTDDIVILTSNRSITMSRGRLAEKVLEDLQKNPYYDKYAQKIATLQNTSPEEFLERIEEKERKIIKDKVFARCLRQKQKPKWSWNIASQLWRTNMIQKQNTLRSYSQTASNCKYITTPIFYVNSVPHIGHLYTALLADVIARFNNMQGDVTLLSTGTDEHGNKVEQAAKLRNMSKSIYCQEVSHEFKKMCDTFEIGYTNFIRTTDPTHCEAVHHFWKLLEDKNHIYKGKYSGWYCISEEAFLSNKDLVEKQTPFGETIKVSAESGHIVEWTEEDNYKFRLSAFRDDLRHWLKDEKVVQPSVFHKILSQWIEDESCTEDLSISRPANRVPWGILTPNDSNQTIYVWFDALINYLTSLGYPDEKFKKFWPPTVQVIGKDILKFHGIYWPAFLMAAGLEPPKMLFCHSHWTFCDEKMSKSKGNVVSPFDAALQFTREGLRYFLIRDSVPHNDSNYSTERVVNIVNNELANTLGNMVHRCGKLIERKEIPSVQTYARVLKSQAADSLRQNMETVGITAKQYYESFNIHHAIDAVMATVRQANVMIDYHRPWELQKLSQNPAAVDEFKSVIALSLEAARISAILLYPVVPTLSTNLLNTLNVPINARNWKDSRPKYLDNLPEDNSKQFNYINKMIFRRIQISC